MNRVREPRLFVREPGLIALTAATGALDTFASFLRHVHLQSGLDLAIFDQVVWHYSRFETPFSSLKGENILGDHFHPLVAVLAPLYWIWSDPRMLLLAQSVLVAASIVPVFLFAQPRLGRTGAYLISGAYAAYWGLQVGVLYDFHELAFAPLLIALAILLADRRRWVWFWVTIALLLLTKEDLAVVAIVLGLYLLTFREVRHGIALVIVGIVWYELTTHVLIPHFNPQGRWVQWTYQELGKNAPGALWALVRAPWRLFEIGFSPAQKARTMAALLAPFLFLSIPSRLFILALPLLGERFLSVDPKFWSTHYHYSMAIAPVLAMGAAAGSKNLLQLVPKHRQGALTAAATATMLLVSFSITAFGTNESTLYRLLKRSFYGAPPQANPAYLAVAHVPASASLASNDFVLPHASERPNIQLLDAQTARAVQYVVIDAVFPQCCGFTGNDSYRSLGQALQSALVNATPTYFHKGWLVAREAPPGTRPGNGVLAPMHAATAQQLGRLASTTTGGLAPFAPCYGKWAAHSPTAAGCFARAGATFDRDAGALVVGIGGARRRLSGGCSELAGAALYALGQWRAAVDGLVRAGLSGARAPLVQAASAAQFQQSYFDPVGQLERFLLLCSPR